MKEASKNPMPYPNNWVNEAWMESRATLKLLFWTRESMKIVNANSGMGRISHHFQKMARRVKRIQPTVNTAGSRWTSLKVSG